MAWYPGATKYELPESDSQPAIRPTQFIVHSIIGPWTAKRTYEYWRDSTNLESHFACGYAGDLGQFVGTETRADANAGANRRPDGTGAVSIETASNLQGSDPWTAAQVERLVELGVWLHQRHGIPLRICRTHDDPGFGYHRLHSAWAVSGTACPGDARVRQFRDTIFPAIVARASNTPEDDMTPEQDRKLTELHRDRQLSPWQYDGQLEAGDAWQLQKDAARDARAAVDAVAGLSAKVDALETHGLTDAQMDRLADLVADKFAARLAD